MRRRANPTSARASSPAKSSPAESAATSQSGGAEEVPGRTYNSAGMTTRGTNRSAHPGKPDQPTAPRRSASEILAAKAELERQRQEELTRQAEGLRKIKQMQEEIEAADQQMKSAGLEYSETDQPLQDIFPKNASSRAPSSRAASSPPATESSENDTSLGLSMGYDSDSDEYQPNAKQHSDSGESEIDPYEEEEVREEEEELKDPNKKTKASAKEKRVAKANELRRSTGHPEIGANAGNVRKRTESLASNDAAPAPPKKQRSKSSSSAKGGLVAGWEGQIHRVESQDSLKAKPKRKIGVQSGGQRSKSRASSRSSGADDWVMGGVQSDGEEQDHGRPAAGDNIRSGRKVDAMAVEVKREDPGNVIKRARAKRGEKQERRRFNNSDLGLNYNDFKTWRSKYVPQIFAAMGTMTDIWGISTSRIFWKEANTIYAELFPHLAASRTDLPFPSSSPEAQVTMQRVYEWRNTFVANACDAMKEYWALDQEELDEADRNKNRFATSDSRKEHVEELIAGNSFVYEDPESKKGAFRSRLVLQTYSYHLDCTKAASAEYDDGPRGALAIAATAIYRELQCWIEGTYTELSGRDNSLGASRFTTKTAEYMKTIEKIGQNGWIKINDEASKYKPAPKESKQPKQLHWPEDVPPQDNGIVLSDTE